MEDFNKIKQEKGTRAQRNRGEERHDEGCWIRKLRRFAKYYYFE